MLRNWFFKDNHSESIYKLYLFHMIITAISCKLKISPTKKRLSLRRVRLDGVDVKKEHCVLEGTWRRATLGRSIRCVRQCVFLRASRTPWWDMMASRLGYKLGLSNPILAALQPHLRTHDRIRDSVNFSELPPSWIGRPKILRALQSHQSASRDPEGDSLQRG